jgi:hypothetical protein
VVVTDRRLQKYLPSEKSFKQALYMFDVGQNDLDGAFYSKSEDQVLALIQTFLTEFETSFKVVYHLFPKSNSQASLFYFIFCRTIKYRFIWFLVLFQKLYNVGARKFWIHNTGPLGCLPRIIAKFGTDTTKLDQFGCVNSHNRAANQLNMQLHDLCTKFRAQLPDANITYVDIFSIKLNLISNYSQYGKSYHYPILIMKFRFSICLLHFGSPMNFGFQDLNNL